ncbi:MAG: Ham1 family protein [Parcubacteria group bacterium Gr01-1014_18]|nr:MAG: Ham1 family protein [Parcubacteria group bacterium Greene0416_36]TSC80244.1 MAG: Ham1 family protein [Parcubacteria group bacterium Gr01-1014_18]TSC98426.1 MAG: Ham1 family protein [Parcubacteria group bacterium Greene1014_20]TSD06967.1 MAG: Ham1 family protein [Parcubacteria group bacterium Greene0714_2]
MGNILFVSNHYDHFLDVAPFLGNNISYKKMDFRSNRLVNHYLEAEFRVEEAYGQFKVPLFTIVPSLCVSYLGNKPGYEMESFCRDFRGDNLCRMAIRQRDGRIQEKCILVFYDGKKMTHFEALSVGSIAPKPEGVSHYPWHSVFIPEGHNLTYAQMKSQDRKMASSFVVLSEFQEFLQTHP